MAPFRGDLGERHEDEGAFLEPRMGKKEPRRRRHPLVPRPLDPGGDGRGVGQDAVARREQVEVADPRTPAQIAAAAERLIAAHADKAAQVNMLHRNTAARKKARLAKRIGALQEAKA